MGVDILSEKDGPALPFLLRNSEGRVVRMVETNEKGFLKSIERGELWHLNRETGRLLPLDGGGASFRDLQKDIDEVSGIAWYQAELLSAGEEVRERGGSAGDSGVAGAEGHATAVEASDPAEAGIPENIRSAERASRSSGGSIIAELETLIRERKKSLPEGSYTTHLFTKGNEKIRKKMGEEAVELLLAREREEIVYETSDLIYHLLVLLVDEGIGFEEIEVELSRRHGS